MKTTAMYYNDDGCYVPGVLICRFLHKPLFVSTDHACGWTRQTINKKNKQNLYINVPKKNSPFDSMIKATNKHYSILHDEIDDD